MKKKYQIAIMVVLGMVLLYVNGFSQESKKKIGYIKPILHLDTLGSVNLYQAANHEVDFTIHKAVLGLEAEITEYVLLHISANYASNVSYYIESEEEGASDTHSFGIDQAFGEITFSKTVPFFTKVGAYTLETSITEDNSPFVPQNNHIISYGSASATAIQLGFKYGEIVRVGVGLYNAFDGIKPADGSKWFVKPKNYFAYIHANYISEELNFLFNISFTSNMNIEGGLDEDTETLAIVDVEYSIVAEFIFKQKNAHYLFSVVAPRVIVLRFEGAYIGEEFEAGAYTSYIIRRKGEANILIKNVGTLNISTFAPPLRFGVMAKYKPFDGFEAGFEGYYDVNVLSEVNGYSIGLGIFLRFTLPDYLFYF